MAKQRGKGMATLPRFVRHRSSEELLRTFGSFVAHKRLTSGLTAREFADKLGVSQSMVSRIESGQREPRLDLLRNINMVLGIEDALVEYLRNGVFPVPEGFTEN